MITVNAMRGLGDSIYSRAFIKRLRGPVVVETPWPELLQDLPNVQCSRPVTNLRTQAKNIARQREWVQKPRFGTQIFVRYGEQGILAGMAQCFGISPAPLDLPDFGPSLVEAPYVVVRPVTLRTEWMACTRNPEPEYVAAAALEAARRGYAVVSVADLEYGKEFIVGEKPPAHLEFHAGQLDVRQLLALIQGAAAVLGGIGWIVPASIAAKVPAWVICGGQGGFNAPELISPQNTTVSFAVPDNFCRCKTRDHNCDKRISNHATIFARWADEHLALV